VSDITIGIKTFLRDEHMMNCLRGINRTFSDANVIVADDGFISSTKQDFYNHLSDRKHKMIIMQFDSGFGAKSNAIAENLDTPYLLIGSDDFDFRPAEVRDGVERLKEVLDYFPDVDIASGRVNDAHYEFNWFEPEPGVLEEVPIDYSNYQLFHPWYTQADITVNYSLIRAGVFDKVRWDNDVKIGQGEHAAFFLDCKRAGFKTVWVPDVNIDELKIRNPPDYNRYRGRANDPGRICFDRRGIKKYVLSGGGVDYKKEEN
jgi:hypothetical protein